MGKKQTSASEKTTKPAAFNPGELVFSWAAHDYHPHNRGVVWYGVFYTLLLAIVVWSVLSDPQWGIYTAFSFLLVAAAYFFFHKDGHETHEIHVFETGFFIDQRKFVSFETIKGYWFVYDETVSVINFQFRGKSEGTKITLQMGEKTPDYFRKHFDKLDIPELMDHQESLIDLWIRALKL